jgi:hypothetical protein
MDINPKRTMGIVGISLLIGGGILYYQHQSHTPSQAREAKQTADNIKRLTEAPKDKKNDSDIDMPTVATPIAKATPVTVATTPTGGILGASMGFGDDKLGPKMTEALQRKVGGVGSDSPKSASSQRSGGSSGSGSSGSPGSGSSGSSGGGSSGSSGAGGGSSGGGGETPGDDDSKGDEEGDEYWIEDGTEIRHNPNCDLYRSSPGRLGNDTEGVACRLCGG